MFKVNLFFKQWTNRCKQNVKFDLHLEIKLIIENWNILPDNTSEFLPPPPPPPPQFSPALTEGMKNADPVLIIYTGLGSPEGLAVDFVSRSLYYTDSKLDVVGATLLDGSYHKTLFNTDMVNPRAIVLDIIRG